MAVTASARRLYMFLGGTFLAGGGLIAAACTTDNGTNTPVPTVNDSGRTDTGGSSGASSGGSSGGSSGDPGDAGADCANIPEVRDSVGPYCFSVKDAGGDGATFGKNCNAAMNEICCSGGPLGPDAGFEPSQCVVATEDTVGYEEGACTGFTTAVQEWHCTEAAHCPGNASGGTDEICCATITDAGGPNPPLPNKDFPGCDVWFTSRTKGTRCRTGNACQAGEAQLCSSDAECKSGTCQPIAISGRYTGICKL